MQRVLLTLVLAVFAAHCGRAPHASAPTRVEAGSPVLPDISGFGGGAVERGSHFVRRTYTRGSESTTVTLARFVMSPAQYDEWLRMSTESYPQVPLGVAAGDGNGFYQCDQGEPSRCNVLVQLRCGLHLEIRGAGTARRTDADAIALGLGLSRMGSACDTVPVP